MLARLPLLIAVRLWAVLLLAAIGLQAAAPVGMPLEARHGSAFSATTFEVALTSQRRVETESEAAPLQPALLPAAVGLPPMPPRTAALPTWLSRPDSTGPPAREILIRQPAPRGPPAA